MDTETAASADIASRCEHCLYFQTEQWDTGYCRLHRMYVVKTFDCARFLQRPHITSGEVGQDASSSVRLSEEQTSLVAKEVAL